MNYQVVLDETLKKLDGKKKLLLHACCAPCSSYVIEYLSEYFDITILYYNPNIDTEEEFNHRLRELKRFVKEFKTKNPVKVISLGYDNKEYLDEVVGLEKELEGGSRCYKCFKLRLTKSCLYARSNNFDYFTTTLTISPLKNSRILNEIGHDLEQEYGINYLYSDFKKREGYKRSIVLSNKYNLYRQDYCGCQFSKNKKIKTY
ncbi:MAG: epoxyqueuosine reductase QueH [Bacilli bacterium]|nr:epoxyqueuosine reductase QueH [Bacilli bacterium]